jgi:hypothetical protein
LPRFPLLRSIPATYASGLPMASSGKHIKKTCRRFRVGETACLGPVSGKYPSRARASPLLARGPLAPVRWVDKDRLAGCGAHSTARRPSTRKHERMYLTLLDHAKFEIAVRWRGRNGVPLGHELLLATAAVESVLLEPKLVPCVLSAGAAGARPGQQATFRQRTPNLAQARWVQHVKMGTNARQRAAACAQYQACSDASEVAPSGNDDGTGGGRPSALIVGWWCCCASYR